MTISFLEIQKLKWIFRPTQVWRRSHHGWWRTASPWRRRSRRSRSWRPSSPRSYNKASEISIKKTLFLKEFRLLDWSLTAKASFPTRLQTKCPLEKFWIILWLKWTGCLVKALPAPLTCSKCSCAIQDIGCNSLIWYKYGVYLCVPNTSGAPGANIWRGMFEALVKCQSSPKPWHFTRT